MTGNDIVDMQVAAKESNWKRRGFLEKLFTKDEQACILGSVSPFITVWRLWTMKESVYKIHNRLSAERSFAPTRIACTIDNASVGRINFDGESYWTRTESTNAYTYTIAGNERGIQPTHSGSHFRLAQTERSDVRLMIEQQLIRHYTLLSGIPVKELMLQKDDRGIPHLLCLSSQEQIPVSITHHGNYAAFTINLNPVLV